MMIVPYNEDNEAEYYGDYYAAQAGGMPVFQGRTIMTGGGLGSVFSGLLRTATPLLKKVAKGLGKRALKTGTRVAGDILAGENVKTSLKRRAKETGKDLLGDVLSGIGDISSPPPKKKKRKTKKKPTGWIPEGQTTII